MRPLDGEQGLGRVGDRLTFGDLADETLAAVGEGDDGRGGPVALGVSMTLGSPPSMMATHELVVPRSIPMIFPMMLISSLS
jgi:NAD-specific glutamate dehydrogenase.